MSDETELPDESEATPRSGGCAPVSGWETAQATALQHWMREVTQLLCYQMDVPMKHKEDLCEAQNQYDTITAQMKRR